MKNTTEKNNLDKKTNKKQIISTTLFIIYIICIIFSVVIYVQNVKVNKAKNKEEKILKKTNVIQDNIVKEFQMDIAFTNEEYKFEKNEKEYEKKLDKTNKDKDKKENLSKLKEDEDKEKDINISYLIQVSKDSKVLNIVYTLKTNNIQNISLEKERLNNQVKEENFKFKELEFETQKENDTYILKTDISVYNGQNSTNTIEKLNKIFKIKKFKIMQISKNNL
ncbi:MAG: hypothetical protein ACTTGJ_03130 [Clostridium sp.]